MRFALALVAAGLAAGTDAHPSHHRGGATAALDKRRIDLSKYRMDQVSAFVNAETAHSSPIVRSLVKRADYVQTAIDVVKREAQGVEFRVVDDHYVGSNGVAHVNFKQMVHGLDIDNANFNVNIGPSGDVLSYASSFHKGALPSESPFTKRAFSNPYDALNSSITTLGLPIQVGQVSSQPKLSAGALETYTLTGATGSVADPEVRLVYLAKGNNDLKLTWRVETNTGNNWLRSYVDASNTKDIYGVVDFTSDFASYNVLPWGVADPAEGVSRNIESDPWLIKASPFTWQGDGTTNYTTTRGNNVVVGANPDGLADEDNTAFLERFRPESAEFDFNFPYDPAAEDPKTYLNASIVQAFYTINRYHDVLYTLGFNEAAGNFQTNNNGRGGLDNDSVVVDVQDGAGFNNANFQTPADGEIPRMRLFLFDRTNPMRDAGFAADIVIHEYTHGVSGRLTGGPAMIGCLGSFEAASMNEGWSDFFALAILTKANATRDTDIAIGSWLTGDSAKGIRLFPYSTSLERNPLTWAAIMAKERPSTNDVGSVWANTLYEMMWNLIDKHGATADEIPALDAKGTPTAGKFLAMKIVLDGLALQGCTPSTFTARDSIIDADKVLTGGDNECEIWRAFAHRGLGVDAVEDQSLPAREGRYQDGFKIPAQC
ncbi:fungalysin metallopeptidase [Colletotrichum truncatum]|uniref:Fungalysin metallopeptidase n=1 Tax=Colletotrichum truncatum TaxID=5467 RepID=A0ACC3YXY1_COLTU|nr:fungalysin metallopeptidase [Colletotrichum truncatum]KAF6790860.1 fungalysin metallopeptidase [Colletotrichum truncatum]